MGGTGKGWGGMAQDETMRDEMGRGGINRDPTNWCVAEWAEWALFVKAGDVLSSRHIGHPNPIRLQQLQKVSGSMMCGGRLAKLCKGDWLAPLLKGN